MTEETVRARAKTGLSINTDDGIDVYIRGRMYDIPLTLYEDNRDVFAVLSGTEEVSEEEIRLLTYSRSRKELNRMASRLGIEDVENYNNKAGVARAIARAEQE